MNPLTKKKINQKFASDFRDIMRDKKVDVNDDPGKYAELAITTALRTYTENTDVYTGEEPMSVKRSEYEDFFRGTDLVIEDPSRTTMSQRITRLDVTIGFDKKDNMPLITPTPTMSIGNHDRSRSIIPIGNGEDYFRFGLRIGNNNYGFDHPVVVVGLCSSQQITPERIHDDMEWLRNNVMDNAPRIIKGAAKTLCRYYYMSDETYRNKINSRFAPSQIDKMFPILVANWRYLDSQQKKHYKPGHIVIPRMCNAAIIDTATNSVVMDGNRINTMKTDIPWMSITGHNIIAMMPKTPRKMPPQTADLYNHVINALLNEPVRRSDQHPAIIVDRTGRPLEKDTRPEAFKNLMKQIRTNTATPLKPAPEKPTVDYT